ncbi:MAG: hypothetical protein M5U19_16335 [Microthrixaceae bacterium]|nr:hypothetical protein [Microthrixaceae bacterium]
MLLVGALLAASCSGDDGVGVDEPVTIDGVSDATGVVGNDGHTCALIDDGTVTCWGGDGTRYIDPSSQDSGSDELRARPVKGISGATAISAGQGGVCALIDDGRVACWGGISVASPDHRTADLSEAPVRIEGLSGASEIATGSAHACAAVEDGPVTCWGENYTHSDRSSGRVSDDVTTPPVTILGISDVTAMAASGHRTCAVVGEGSVSCWTPFRDVTDDDGHILTPRRPHSIPVDVTEIPGVTDAAAIAVGGEGWSPFACVVHRDRTVSCWGNNRFGKLGDGTYNDSDAPVRVGDIDRAAAIAAGPGQACAVIEEGSVRCWGSELVGTGDTPEDPVVRSRPTPVATEAISGATAIATMWGRSCAVIANNEVSCWGFDVQLALRDG